MSFVPRMGDAVASFPQTVAATAVDSDDPVGGTLMLFCVNDFYFKATGATATANDMRMAAGVNHFVNVHPPSIISVLNTTSSTVYVQQVK